MDSYMSQAMLRPTELTGPSYIASKKPDLWLDAGRGLGTAGSRFFTVTNGEYFSLTTKPNPGISDFWISSELPILFPVPMLLKWQPIWGLSGLAGRDSFPPVFFF